MLLVKNQPSKGWDPVVLTVLEEDGSSSVSHTNIRAVDMREVEVAAASSVSPPSSLSSSSHRDDMLRRCVQEANNTFGDALIAMDSQRL